jgi:hypothetical protein
MTTTRRLTALVAAVSLLAATGGCAHTVAVYSTPPGAEIYVNGRSIGRTPTTFEERSGYHRRFQFRAELPGYEPWTEEHEQKQPSKLLIPSVVGAYVLLLPIIGVLWGYQLDDEITLELRPAN